MSLTFTTTRFPLYSCLCALAALVLLAIPGAAQNTATLTVLTLEDDQGTNVPLSPTFASATIQYTATVAYSVVYVEVEGTASSGDTVHPLGIDSESKQGHQIALNRGSTTTINVDARASGKTTTTYTVTVTSTPASTDAELADLRLSDGDNQSVNFSPTFAATTTSYSASIPHTTTSLTVTPDLPDGATVRYQGATDSNTSTEEVLEFAPSVGKTTITIRVTAEDGTTTKPYTLTVTRDGPDAENATLSDLTLTNPTVTLSFAKATTQYAVSVANTVESITVTADPTAENATATIDGNDATDSGYPVNLSEGNNEIRILVTAPDESTTQLYILTVMRLKSDAGTLSGLRVSVGTLSPAFDKETKTYNVGVAHAVTSITITPTPTVPGATIAYNKSDSNPSTDPLDLALVEGNNVIEITVTAPDGTTTLPYTLTVTRARTPRTDATLSGLRLSAGTLDPAFSPGRETYTAEVYSEVTSITVTATKNVSGATVAYDPTDADTNTNGYQVNLTEGDNPAIRITVTSEDVSTTKTYTLTVTRDAASATDATLQTLSLVPNVLSPTFTTRGFYYTASVGHTVGFLEVTATKNVSEATVTYNRPDSKSNTADVLDVALTPGQTTRIEITVTSKDKRTTETYIIDATRALAPSRDATLSSLTLSEGGDSRKLNQIFDPYRYTYTASVAHDASLLTIVATPSADGEDAIAYNLLDADTNTEGHQVATQQGATTRVTVTVTAPDGTTKENYHIDISRAAPPRTDATLSSLTLTSPAVPLSPEFDPTRHTYNASVGRTATEITVTATPNATGAIPRIDGVDAYATGNGLAVTLDPGATTRVTVTVTAQDGTTTKTYQIDLTRSGSSADATLRSLTLSGGATLSPSFSSNRTSYTASVANSVSSITITAAPTVSGSRARIGNADATSGHPVSLSVGSNTIQVVVTAQDGTTTKTYQITLTRSGSPADATLRSLTLSGATLSPSFSSNRTSYTASVANSVSSITITAAPAVSGSEARIGNADATSGHRVSLSVGSNTIRVVVTAQDGTQKTYRITVTRAGRSTAGGGGGGTPPRRDPDPPQRDPDPPDPDPPKPSNDATLKELALSGGAALSPAFAPSTTQYTAEVGATISVVTVTATRAHTRAKVTFSLADADAGLHGQQIALVEGDNTITVVVVAQDGRTTKQYTLIITRLATGQEPAEEPEKDPPPALAADATLKMLSVSGGGATLSPAFSSSTIAYIAQVGSNIGIVTVAAEANAAEASVAITPGDADKRMAGHQVPLRSYGGNQVTVVVTAEDGTTKTYRLTVHRLAPKGEPAKEPASPSQDATLKALAVSAGTLTPAFAATHQLYTAQVAHHVATLTVIPVAAAAGASVTITPADADLATDGHQVALQVGNNPVAVLVTATDGKQKAYILTITRAAQADGAAETDGAAGAVGLRSLTISEGTLTPAFVATTYQYTAQVAHHVATLTVAASARTGASVTFTPADAAPATDGHQVALQVGDNPVAVLVTATDGKQKAYILTITRAAQADGAAGLQFVGSVPDQHYTTGAAIAPLVVPEAVGGQGQVAYRMAGLPGGLSFAQATRTISGTPTTATGGAVEVACIAEDSQGAVAILSFAVTVNPPLTFGDLFINLSKASGKNEREGVRAAAPQNRLRFQAANEQGE